MIFLIDYINNKINTKIIYLYMMYYKKDNLKIKTTKSKKKKPLNKQKKQKVHEGLTKKRECKKAEFSKNNAECALPFRAQNSTRNQRLNNKNFARWLLDFFENNNSRYESDCLGYGIVSKLISGRLNVANLLVSVFESFVGKFILLFVDFGSEKKKKIKKKKKKER